MKYSHTVFTVLILCILHSTAAQQCGTQASGKTCSGDLCCSQYGYCGTTSDYCGSGCQSQCGGGGGGCTGLTCLIDSNMYDKLWPNRNAIYTYDSFAKAAASYPKIGTEGNQQQKLREVAAFAAHVQQETAGLYYIREIDQSNSYCDNTDQQYPCVSGQKYFGRGPLQISWNYNYGAARDAGAGGDILKNPDLVAQDGAISFRTAFWFWTRVDSNIPSMHEVMVGKWTPTQADTNAGRKPGFGMTINIINGGIECGKSTQNAANRIQYYKQFCQTLGVDPGSNLDCTSMKPYNSLVADV
ncbi:unnamed protein product [Calypogeia fissa]